MTPIKFRTIEEAKALTFPKTPKEHIDEARRDFDFVRGANASRLAKVKRIYHAADLLASEISPLAVCQKGCGHCCHIDVGVTEIEAQYIERNTGARKNFGTSRSSGHGETKTPCPFLSVDHTCSIYEFRPFACRTYFAFDDPRYCNDNHVTHVTYDARGNPILADFARLLLELNGQGRWRDIRDFFAPVGA
ncbi:YkgJ family cysteine cluster protein [Paraburkholderia sp. B3]|uniref:YkgJ family cysteine cluster protein n=1 Tax=Paraburkholderia sp. B3 TaxID=3134791 RepID=UPI00398264A1